EKLRMLRYEGREIYMGRVCGISGRKGRCGKCGCEAMTARKGKWGGKVEKVWVGMEGKVEGV
ncbi:hypothetical protein, partial [Bacillus thuringiensis]|uniref:hypothetical protein n=1 Tax=Bacillus thuringiensis TaxID=1428 RepID=UPI0037BEA3D6